MLNKNELKAEMVRHGDSSQSLAKFLGISPISLSKKMGGFMEFKLSEVTAIIRRYNLSPNDYDRIFFGFEVS